MDFMVQYIDDIGNVRFDKVKAVNFGNAADIIRARGEIGEFGSFVNIDPIVTLYGDY